MIQTEKYPSQVLQDAVEAISSLPGIGSRSALRLALHLLKQPSESIHRFAAAVDSLAEDVHYCKTCMMISDGDQCSICSDHGRDHNTICVVESVRDVMSIEATGQYRGVYHVLGGIISPINGVGPSDLNIRQLVSRLESMTGAAAPGEEEGPGRLPSQSSAGQGLPLRNSGNPDGPGRVEVIMALSGDVEGETTAFYIYRQIERFGCRISSLARGLGFGDDLEYADSLTLGRSIVNRTPFKP